MPQSESTTLIQSLPDQRFGLILGPGYSIGPEVFNELESFLRIDGETSNNQNFLRTVDQLLHSGEPLSNVERRIRDFYNTQHSSPLLQNLATQNWSAIISFCHDDYFLLSFEEEQQKKYLRRSVTTLTPPHSDFPPRSISVSKLLGSIKGQRLICGYSDYIRQPYNWNTHIREFIDRVRGGAVVCLGFAVYSKFLEDLFSSWVASSIELPAVVCLADKDPLLNNFTLNSLLKNDYIRRVRPVNVSEFLSAMKATSNRNLNRDLIRPNSDSYGEINQYCDIALLVNNFATTNAKPTEVQRLGELLFSPLTLNWEPFILDFDFERSHTQSIFNLISDKIVATTPTNAVSMTALLVGPVASGKTTTLKRLALNLTRLNELVLWIRPDAAYVNRYTLVNLFKAVKNSGLCKRNLLTVFIDDRVQLGSLTPKAIYECAESVSLKLFFIVGLRTFDHHRLGDHYDWGPATKPLQFDIPETLDDSEISRLPSYLVKIGHYKSRHEADNALSERSKNTTDTLCLLYWLLPKTRHSIKESIRDEFFRVGSGKSAVNALIDNISDEVKYLRQIYELVAVSHLYQVPLPVEVLTNALGLSYTDYSQTIQADIAQWGFIDTDSTSLKDSYSHTMRNAILAETIVETINGGSLNKTGEVKILRMLVSGCSGSRPLYFEFCTRLLVNNIKFQKRLSFEEGLQVFEDCIKALPRKSRTITHHYALWLSSRGEDPKKALEVINGTFQIPEDPSVADSEPDGLLHTTAAKLSLRVIRADPSVVEEYKQEALYHIQKIRSTGFFDEKAIHILSGIVIQLVKVYPNKIDQLKLINTTLADIDRVLFKSDSIFNQTWRSSLETNWLQTRRIELFELTVKNSESLEAYAEKVWSEYESQDGYIVLLRQKFHKARTSKKGTLFKKALEACDRIIKKIESAKKSVSSGLYEVKSHIFYQWRVKNSRAIKAHGHTAAIDWKILKETSKKVIQLSEDQNSLLFAKYLHALSLCHLDEWGGANEIFRDIRKNNSLGKQLYHTRDVLVDRTGMKRRVQGRVKRGSRKRYFCPESIPTEFVLSTNKMWPKHDAPIHVFIEFSFAGTTATPC